MGFSRPAAWLRERSQTIVLALWSSLLAVFLSSCVGLQSSSPATPRPTGSTTTVAAGNGNVPVPNIDRLREDAANKVSPAVVKIDVGNALGSGVIMTNDGYIVTNHHVVANAQSIQVTLATGDTLKAQLVGSDPVDDLAVVKVQRNGLPVAQFGDSTKLQVGQTVMAIGNPLGITRTVTDGIVSALNRTVREGQGGGSIPNAVQTSAPINPGNSGGALINLGGQVIGIPTLTAIDPEFNTAANGIGFAIPSNVVTRITQQLIHNGRVIHSGRAALGIYAASVTQELASEYNLPIDHGVLVARVQPNGGAAKAGIQRLDVIVKVGDTPINSESDLLDVLGKENPGDTVSVTVVRSGGEQKTYRVTLGELPVNSTGYLGQLTPPLPV